MQFIDYRYGSNETITPPKKRKKTKPTKVAKQKRLEKKKIVGKTRSLRRKNPKNDE